METYVFKAIDLAGAPSRGEGMPAMEYVEVLARATDRIRQGDRMKSVAIVEE